jgi:hypothetical protein
LLLGVADLIGATMKQATTPFSPKTNDVDDKRKSSYFFALDLFSVLSHGVHSPNASNWRVPASALKFRRSSMLLSWHSAVFGNSVGGKF